MNFMAKKMSFQKICAGSLAACTFLLPLKVSAETACKTANGVTRFSFHTDSEVQIEPNLLILHLRASRSASNPSKAQAELNQLISRALANARQEQKNIHNLEIQTGDYSVAQTSAPDAKPVWNASEEFLLKAPLSQDKPHQSEALLHLGGSLQTLGLALQDIEWSLDDKTRKAAKQKAVHQALAEILPQAEEAGKPLGLKFTGLESVSVDRPYFQGNYPRPMLMSMANRSAEKAPPQSEAHALKITAGADAVALLKK